MAKTKASTGDEPVDKITVQGPASGRWRCGFKFGPEPQVVLVTKEQFDDIASDPYLKLVPPQSSDDIK